MADGYATLANGGIHHDPTAISKVEFPDGKVDESEHDEGERVLTQGQAYEVTRILEGVITQGTGAGYTSIGLHRRGRQDRHLGGALRRLVRRLHAALLDRGLGRPPAVARRNRLRRPDRRSDLANYMESAAQGECPEFETPTLPELAGLDSEHTSSGSSEYESYEDEEESESEDEESEERAKARPTGAAKKPPPSRTPPRNRPTRARPDRPAPPAAASAQADAALLGLRPGSSGSLPASP